MDPDRRNPTLFFDDDDANSAIAQFIYIRREGKKKMTRSIQHSSGIWLFWDWETRERRERGINIILHIASFFFFFFFAGGSLVPRHTSRWVVLRSTCHFLSFFFFR